MTTFRLQTLTRLQKEFTEEMSTPLLLLPEESSNDLFMDATSFPLGGAILAAICANKRKRFILGQKRKYFNSRVHLHF